MIPPCLVKTRHFYCMSNYMKQQDLPLCTVPDNLHHKPKWSLILSCFWPANVTTITVGKDGKERCVMHLSCTILTWHVAWSSDGVKPWWQSTGWCIICLSHPLFSCISLSCFKHQDKGSSTICLDALLQIFCTCTLLSCFFFALICSPCLSDLPGTKATWMQGLVLIKRNI